MDDNSIVINPSSGTSSTNRYFCSHCNTQLTPYTQEDKIGGYLCTKCIIEYWPTLQPVKKADKFDLPGPETDEPGNVIGDKDIPIAMIDTPKASPTAHSQNIAAAYKALSRYGYGFRWLTYEER